MEPEKINDTFKAEVEKTTLIELDIPSYIKASFESEKKDAYVENAKHGCYCEGWDYLKANLTKELKECLLSQDFWNLVYLEQETEFIVKKTGANLSVDERKQLHSFVYVWNDKMRESEKAEERDSILKQGYEEISGQQKEFDGIKVKGIFSISKMGIMGSFNANEEKEGKLIWSENHKSLMLIPKRSRTRGYMIRDKAYIKRVI